MKCFDVYRVEPSYTIEGKEFLAYEALIGITPGNDHSKRFLGTIEAESKEQAIEIARDTAKRTQLAGVTKARELLAEARARVCAASRLCLAGGLDREVWAQYVNAEEIAEKGLNLAERIYRQP